MSSPSMAYPENWQWQADRGPGAMGVLAPEWDNLVRALGLPLVSGTMWLRCFWESFGTADRGLAILSAREDGRLVAILPLVGAESWLRTWSPVANFHSPSLAFASEPLPEGAAAAVLNWLVGCADVVELGPVQCGDAFCRTLLEAARSRRLPVAEDPSGSDAVIELRGPWEGFRRSLSRNLESATARHHRQLQRLGKLDFEEVGGGDRLPAVLEECFRLEAAGWKAQHGSPILARQDTLRFYTELAHRAAAAGVLAVYVLRLDGKPVAFEFCLRAARRIDMLKISYAPRLSRYSPGNVLRYLILQREVERGEIAIYHMGRSSEWKLRWANRVDPLVRLRIYGTRARARVAYRGARLRALLRQCRPLRAAVRWTRNMREAIRRRGWPTERAGT